ncbi:LysR family transcriptional regulator [Pseudogulbenkiania subflava]|uniref:DNA-binding transcriptional regulator, LysR family n=1 Tax=Pseudogulbenkiania subflava DSM 22618 TaxID=1123014 RepID=A0A1Y6BZB1_9NEIS|nr:LysR family transcriptional regulator [Pseudogulbenkiania subflava]SMF33127.1 DNA-binding transcriptional regulator, LysR family [Pseudogulbenkiania subflava DSM 22618]
MQTADVRLLQVFDEIYKTRSVTRAADNLGLGQPAVSIALAKLREHFDDPLFVRIANGMEPTPMARELERAVRQALDALDLVFGHRIDFDPASSERTFCISMTDISQLVLLPKLWAHLRKTSPGVHIDIVPLSAETPRMLETGEADLALGFMPQLEAGFYQQSLFRQRYVCVASTDHPRIRDELTLAQFETEEHAVVTSSGTGHLILDREIARQGITRHIALRVPNYLGIAFVVEQTDMLVMIPERLAQVLEGRGRFKVFPVPFELPDYAVKQHWHERYHHDPGNRWLRRVISELLSAATPAA